MATRSVPVPWPAAGGPSTSRATRCGTTIRHASSTDSRISSASIASSRASSSGSATPIRVGGRRLGPRRYQCGAFIPRKSDADLGLVLAERDVHDLTDTELHTITHQHLAAPRQPRKHCSDVVDSGHASIMASGRGRPRCTIPNDKPGDLFIRPDERSSAYGIRRGHSTASWSGCVARAGAACPELCQRPLTGLR